MSSQAPIDSRPTIDQHQWIVSIKEALAQETNGNGSDDAETPISIFRVSKSLFLSKPEAYIPHQVAIGPYHQWRSELHEMERYKFMAARRMQQEHLQGITFDGVVEKLARQDYQIRSCYAQYLDITTETLAWMVAVDASFLLEFFRAYGGDQTSGRDDVWRVSSRMSQVMDHVGKSMTHNAILRDIVLLENQIPLFVLRHLMGCCQHEDDDETLARMLMGVCGSLIPFRKRTGKNFPLGVNEVLQMGNLVELLYHVCIHKSEEISATEYQAPLPRSEEPRPPRSCSTLVVFFSPFLRQLRPLKSVLIFPFRMVGKKMVKLAQSRNVLKEVQAGIGSREMGSMSMRAMASPQPLLDELMIPSVAQLHNAGIRFHAAKGGGIWSIKFDRASGTLHLPCITFDENTDVVLRNLVAFEATSTSRPQILTRYTELMNGIIDTEEDVRLLREKGVVLNHLKSDAEVADRWNGMTRAMFLSKVGHLDNVIEDVNRYYSRRWRVRFGKLLEQYVYRSWPFLTLVAANVFLLLTALQAFCSVFGCGDAVRVGNFAGGMMNSSTLTGI
ncbi:hypothetical protein ACLOJK_027575 [Asimina triloba]